MLFFIGKEFFFIKLELWERNAHAHISKTASSCFRINYLLCKSVLGHLGTNWDSHSEEIWIDSFTGSWWEARLFMLKEDGELNALIKAKCTWIIFSINIY